MARRTVTVRPAEGLMVTDPETGKALPDRDKGTAVPFNRYWARRIAVGDVIEVEAAKAAAKASAVTPKSTSNKD